MSLNNILFLFAMTPRSQVYAETFRDRGLKPDSVLLFGRKSFEVPVLPGDQDSFSGLSLPQFESLIPNLFKKENWPYDRVDALNVNDPKILECIKQKNPELIVYSGVGGQLVGNELLELDIPFLHAHSGWLPDYRGSTTLYYSWLKEGYCGVSAFLLKEKIDQGPIVLRKKFPTPPEGIDIDYVYDSLIRADVLSDVLESYRENGKLPEEPEEGRGTDYYVIHPVLKHIARLKNQNETVIQS